MLKPLLALDDESLDAFLSLADVDHDGRVDEKEFLMIIALLTKGCLAPVQQVDACFAMFDTDGNGNLDEAEFRRLIKVSVNLGLQNVLSTAEGEARMQEQQAESLRMAHEQQQAMAAAAAAQMDELRRQNEELRAAMSEQYVDGWRLARSAPALANRTHSRHGRSSTRAL